MSRRFSGSGLQTGVSFFAVQCYHAGLPHGSRWDWVLRSALPILSVIGTRNFLQFLGDFKPAVHQ